jgi:hypothetical protein
VALGLKQPADNPPIKHTALPKAAFCNIEISKNGHFEWLPMRRPN